MGFFKNPLKEIKNAVTNAVKQPLKAVESTVKVATGVAATVGTGGLNLVFASKEGQKALNTKVVDQLTFGLSGDLAGASSATTKLAGGRDPTKEELADTFRFAAKAAVVATGAAIENAGAGATGAGTVSSVTGSPLQSYGAGQLAQSSIKSGNYAGALAAIGGNTFLNQILPGGNAGDFLNSILPTGARPTPPTIGGNESPSYFADPGYVSVGATPSTKSALPTAAVLAAVVGVAFVAARRL